MVTLKKLPIAVGLLLIFVGVIVTSSYNASVTNSEWKTETEINGGWTISGNFSSGENITLTVAWSAVTYGEDLGELPANVTITANNGDTAKFAVYFLSNPDIPPGQDTGRQQIYVSRIELLNNDGDSLKVDDPPKQIGGIVKQTGAFEARVHPPPDSFPWAGYPEAQPPDALRLLKVIVNTRYPYRDFFPAGAVTGIAGGAVILLGRYRTNRGDTVRARKLRTRARKSR